MSAVPPERTVLPGEPAHRMVELLVALRAHGRPALVGADGTRIELPQELYEVLTDVVGALSQGLAITVAPQHTVLTTSQAAEILGISRPTLVRLLESGEIPFLKPGRHRRVRLRDVLASQERARRARAAGLDEMMRVSEDAGVYEIPEGAELRRLEESAPKDTSR